MNTALENNEDSVTAGSAASQLLSGTTDERGEQPPEAAAAAADSPAAVRTVKSSAPNEKHDASQNDEIPNHNAAKRKAESLDSDSEIEDVTDQYVKKKRPASPEIIEVEDVSSDEESCNTDQSASYYANTKQSCAHDTDNDDSSDGGSSVSADSDIEDVTEFMLAKKKEQFLQDIDGAIELGDSDSGDDANNTNKINKKRRSSGRPRKRKKATESPILVELDEKDVPLCPGQKSTAEDEEETDTDPGNDAPAQANDVDHSIKQRIVKLLNTGFHAESNENEAKNAMKLARRYAPFKASKLVAFSIHLTHRIAFRRLMERYNLDQSVLLRERGDGSLNDFSTTNDDKEGSTLGGGIVTVNICNRKKAKVLSSLPRWIDFLVQPICANFHVDAFKSISKTTVYRAGECKISFYGIRTNAQLAAYAFKISCEKISFMATNYDPPEVFGRQSDTKNARLSYALGIVIGLDRDVTEELRKEAKRRKAKLNKARRAAKSDKDASNEDSDAEDSMADDGDDAEHPIDLTLEQLETENAAQVALVDHQKKIAKEVLKVSHFLCAIEQHSHLSYHLHTSTVESQKHNIKVSTGRKKKALSVDLDAYEKGIIDSKAIDINQQAIGD